MILYISVMLNENMENLCVRGNRDYYFERWTCTASNQKIIWGSKTKHKAGTRITTQKAATMIYVRFKVTVCVYSAPPAMRQVCLQLWLSSSMETLHIMHNCYAGLEMSPSRHWPRIQRSWTKTSINSLESMCNKTNSQMRCCRTKIQEFRLRMEGRFQVK